MKVILHSLKFNKLHYEIFKILLLLIRSTAISCQQIYKYSNNEIDFFYSKKDDSHKM